MNYRPSYALYCAMIVSIGGFVFGFDAAVISGVVGAVTREFDLSPIEAGFVVAAPTLSGLFGTMVAGPLSDTLGRRRILIAIASIYVLSALGSALATSYTMLVGARALGGVAFTSLMLAPLYIGEISPSAVRGKRVSINQLNIVIGLSAAYFSNYFLLQLSTSDAAWVNAIGIDTHAWRWMLGLELLPAGLYFLLLFSVPDTPRWLILKGRRADAERVLGQLLPLHEASAELNSIEPKSVSSPSLIALTRELFGHKVRLALVIGIIVAITQQITGINAIFFYAPTIFEQSGIGTNAAFSQAAMVGVINVLFTIAAMALIDRWGRKPLLILGLSGIVVSMAVCSWGFANARYQLSAESAIKIETEWVAEGTTTLGSLDPLIGRAFDSDIAFKRALRAAIGEKPARDHESVLIQSAIEMNAVWVLIGILGFVASFAISLGPVMWVLFAEIFPNHLRGVAVSFVGFINGLVSYNVQLIFPLELNILGAATTFFLYGVFAVVGLLLIVRLMPETKGLSLEALEALFSRR